MCAFCAASQHQHRTCTRAMVLLMALYRISQAAPLSDSSPSAVTPSDPNTHLQLSKVGVVWEAFSGSARAVRVPSGQDGSSAWLVCLQAGRQQSQLLLLQPLLPSMRPDPPSASAAPAALTPQ